MDSTPPYHYHRSDPKSRTKSSSRLARIGDREEPLPTSLDLVPSPTNSPSPSSLSLRSPTSLPLKELLLLSPSPLRRSKTRLADRLEMGEEFVEPAGVRRRCKTRGAQMGVLASPRSARRSRRRSEYEIREDLGLPEEIQKPRKRRHSGKPKKEKLSLVPSVPSSISSPKIEDENGGNLDRIGQLMIDLVMWKDVAKSTLWFGFGSLCFLSSCFTNGINFSIFSALSHLAILFLGLSFFSNSISRSNQVGRKYEVVKLTEDDILRLAKLILPVLNLAISKTRELFSGETSMTLKLAPFLLLGAEYGHLITIWRLCAIGFFVSFPVPKLFSCYYAQINQRAQCLKSWLLDTWCACSHKKLAVLSAFIAFWNLSTIKTRIFTAFISLVIFRFFRQHAVQKVEEGEAAEGEEEQQQAMVAAEPGEKEQPSALVVAEQGSQN
ncbi:hypothetical protein L6164_018680 [Bauhinia variegata]|uniref:Uncharacterized protein n=1 Tax=Bauhinia variegata TaxID=167791 RepID=A0ACB9NFH4_BAUVA|nr:hypothetical protein L6164_018680 [Bauhinia variegata]